VLLLLLLLDTIDLLVNIKRLLFLRVCYVSVVVSGSALLDRRWL